jgi:hypothetical protein
MCVHTFGRPFRRRHRWALEHRPEGWRSCLQAPQLGRQSTSHGAQTWSSHGGQPCWRPCRQPTDAAAQRTEHPKSMKGESGVGEAGWGVLVSLCVTTLLRCLWWLWHQQLWWGGTTGSARGGVVEVVGGTGCPALLVARSSSAGSGTGTAGGSAYVPTAVPPKSTALPRSLPLRDLGVRPPAFSA